MLRKCSRHDKTFSFKSPGVYFGGAQLQRLWCGDVKAADGVLDEGRPHGRPWGKAGWPLVHITHLKRIRGERRTTTIQTPLGGPLGVDCLLFSSRDHRARDTAPRIHQRSGSESYPSYGVQLPQEE